MGFLKKAGIGLTSGGKVLGAKTKCGRNLRMSLVNSLRGPFRVEIQGRGRIQAGSFLMSQGPLYLKATDGAVLTLGERVFFNHNCSVTCAEKITIGDHCMFANNLVIVDHDHVVGPDGVTAELRSAPVVIGDRVWCGANVTITKGVHIGAGAVIGANSVVTKDVEAHSVVAGVPAKKIR